MYENVNLIGRVIFGLYFAYSGLNHFLQSKGMIGYASMKKLPMPSLAVYGSGLLMIVGGLGFAFGLYMRASLSLILLFLIPVTVLMHDFWNDADEGAKGSNKVQFLKNLALIGACLAMF
jgi:uncharacterized membrane protein YphA (DoxX/SURF4 family)